jgi:hypothetical protein
MFPSGNTQRRRSIMKRSAEPGRGTYRKAHGDVRAPALVDVRTILECATLGGAACASMDRFRQLADESRSYLFAKAGYQLDIFSRA